MTLLSVYFMIYYTTVVGLDPKALATLFLISKVMDGISDPVMGFILDRFPVTKMGKFRPMLILGTIICHKLYSAVVWRCLESCRKICDRLCYLFAVGMDL